jgi:hypothetical protein
MTDEELTIAAAKIEGFWSDQIGLAMNTPNFLIDHNAVQRLVDRLDRKELVCFTSKLRRLVGDSAFIPTATCRQKLIAIMHCLGEQE